MIPTILAVKTAIIARATAPLQAAEVQEIFSYRTLKAVLSPVVMFSNAGNMPQAGAVGENSAYYDFNLYAAAKYEKDDNTSQQFAEQMLDQIEDAVIESVLTDDSHTLWEWIKYRRASVRPPSPQEYIGWRWMEIYLRVQLH